MIAPERKIS